MRWRGPESLGDGRDDEYILTCLCVIELLFGLSAQEYMGQISAKLYGCLLYLSEQGYVLFCRLLPAPRLAPKLQMSQTDACKL